MTAGVPTSHRRAALPPRARRARVALALSLGGVLLMATPASAQRLPAAPAAAGTRSAPAPGYGIVRADGVIATLGGAAYLGDQYGQTLDAPVVGAAATPDRRGYWMAAADGGVFAYGDAAFDGSMGGHPLNQPIVGMAATPSGGGYWLVAADGGIFSFGAAAFYGSTGALVLNRPIVGMAATADGRGYWLVAADGGIFSFGDAAFYGSTGALVLNRPVVGMAATADGRGYWLVASDGGVFTFGDATFYGSTGALDLVAPVAAILPSSAGYLLVGQDGGVFAFGNAPYLGSAADPLHPPDYPASVSETNPPSVAALWLAPGPQAAAGGPVRVSVMGDSLAYLLSFGFAHLEDSYGTEVQNGAISGCGMLPGATVLQHWTDPTPVPTVPACQDWAQRDSASMAASHPDVVALLSGYWESQRWEVGDQVEDLTDPSFAAGVAAQLAQFAALVHQAGAQLVLLSAPYYDDGTPDQVVDDYNVLLDQLAQQDGATVIDLHGLLDPGNVYSATVDGVTVRAPDGVHLTFDGVTQVLTPDVLPQLVSIGQRAR